MKQSGTVEFVDVLQNHSGKSKGTAFIRYSTDAEAANAIAQLNGSVLDGKTLVVDPWTGPKPKKQGQKGGNDWWGEMMAMMKGKAGGKGVKNDKDAGKGNGKG